MNREIIVHDDHHLAPITGKNLLQNLKKAGMDNLMNKQVNQMNKWKQALLLGAGVLFSSVSFAENTYSATLQWDEDLKATHYQVQEEINGTWENVPETPASGNTYEVPARVEGTYKFRVGGCVEEPNVKVHCGGAVAVWSEGYALTLPLSDISTQRRVIFIHTDLLGSPAAETDEDGNIQGLD
jgi:hypothetical protein